ncbi:MAG: carboxymuconolactone decarboxylase family protein [Mariniblastus sp.]|nr:carboxymuconolactone decarboxylase family protein [Mariniblastus sp.]
MAFIDYLPVEQQSPANRIDDSDHILQVHSVHSAVMRQHWELYRGLMHAPSPLSRRQREMVAVVVSSLNECHY